MESSEPHPRWANRGIITLVTLLLHGLVIVSMVVENRLPPISIAERGLCDIVVRSPQRINMQQLRFDVCVVMQKRVVENRWLSEMWEPVAVLSDGVHESESGRVSGSTRLVSESDGIERWIFPAMPVVLRREEAEGYYLNISTPQPRVFVMWQLHDEQGVPLEVSASYNDACSWMDAGEQVDSVAMPPDMYDAVSEFAREHYRPQPKKRIRPRSFQSRDDRPRSRQR